MSAMTAATPSTPPAHILLVEDEVNVGRGLQLALDEEGYHTDLCPTGRRAIEEFEREAFDLVVADLRLPDLGGMEVVRRVKGERPDVEVIVITGYPTVSTAVEAMKIGAYDYLPKPFGEDELRIAVRGALEHKEAAGRTEAEDLAEIQKREVLRVLRRAAEEQAFTNLLRELGSVALSGYELTNQAKAAIVSGDLRWLRAQVGELTPEQRRWVDARLQMEVW